MPEIKLTTIDTLNVIVSDLEVLTYLRDIVLYDVQHGISKIGDRKTKISAELYLFQRQTEVVQKLTETVFCENFAKNKNDEHLQLWCKKE